MSLEEGEASQQQVLQVKPDWATTMYETEACLEEQDQGH